MIDSIYEQTKPLKAYLVGVRRAEDTLLTAEEHLEELRELVATMGMPVAGEEMASIQKPTAAYLFGSGKVSEIEGRAKMAEAELIIIDDDLTPAQQRNWEKDTKLAVIDRREVILDIFRQRAQTREATLQVRLAKLEYSLPRLKRAWTHLERQRGGGGFTGGAGEAQIEIDRRLIKTEIATLKSELKEVGRSRATQRKSRGRRPVPTAALVGYTNSGKSTILNAITGAGVLAEDKLFATLDPTTRRVVLPNNQELLLSDTVGFIRKLPHMLVEAFMATLEEARFADVLVHVVDASHPAALDHLQATREVLHEIDACDQPVLHVLNKMDRVTDEVLLARLCAQAQPFIKISALTGEGIDRLGLELAALTSGSMTPMHLLLPHDRYDLVSFAHREGHILAERYHEEGVELEIEIPVKFTSRLEAFTMLEGQLS